MTVSLTLQYCTPKVARMTAQNETLTMITTREPFETDTFEVTCGDASVGYAKFPTTEANTMAPAAAAKSMTPAELTQARVDETRRAAAAINSELAGHRANLSRWQAERTEAEAQHKRDRMSLASGSGGDPAISKTLLDAIAYKIAGAEDHIAALTPKADVLSKAANKAELQHAWQQSNDELADLLKAELEAKDVATVAIQKGDEMARAHGAVVFQVGVCRKKLSAIEAEMRSAQ